MSTLLQAAQAYVAERFKDSTLQKPLIDAFAEVAADFAISQASARWSDEDGIDEPVAYMTAGHEREFMWKDHLDHQCREKGDAQDYLKGKYTVALYTRPSTVRQDHALLSGEGEMEEAGTGLIGFDGTELREGDTVEFMDGPYLKQRAVIAWNPKGMWSLKYGNDLNPYWIENPERLKVVK